MISNPFYLIARFSDTLIIFFSWTIIVEVIMHLFSIKKHRLRSNLRLLPFIHLIIGFAFNEFSVARWLNPLSCASCTQDLILNAFYPQIKSYLSINEISLIRYLGTGYLHPIFPFIVLSTIIFSCFLALRYILKVFFHSQNIKSIIVRGTLSKRPILNIRLIHSLCRNKVSIYISDEIKIPCAVFNRAIIIPKGFMNCLTQSEFEAVIAHELEHIVHRDPFIRFFYHGIAILFWWVPTQAWINKIEKDQELACDQNILNYDLPKESVASALFKIAKQSIPPKKAICLFADEKNSIKLRVKAILGLTSTSKNSTLQIAFGSLGIIFLLMCMIK